MAKTERFSLGFLQLDTRREDVFLSVTPGFEHGPGIQRDGLTPPRMTDPHSVPRIHNHFKLAPVSRSQTSDAHLQRAGTWTIYHHVKRFIQKHGNDWQIVAVQSNGDLTMNPWHIAYLGQSNDLSQKRELCALLTDGDPQEPVSSRIYRSFVKWRPAAAKARGRSLECFNLRIESVRGGRALKINDPDIAAQIVQDFKDIRAFTNSKTGDIASEVEFMLSGKPLVEDGVELSLANTIDRFEDIRHVFNLPTVPADGFHDGQAIKQLNFGEYQLFKNLNERRAAMSCPVIIDLDIDGRVAVKWEDVAAVLRRRRFKESAESPTRKGQFRFYRDQAYKQQVEIYFPYNVYPFGVLGLQEPQADGGAGLVSLSSGGLSGRVGNTLEGTARIMFDFFGCTDAMVLDEGYDVFFISNPISTSEIYKYSNEQLLRKILTFTKERLDKDQVDSVSPSSSSGYPGGMKSYPLNIALINELEADYVNVMQDDYADVLVVAPQRSQMRSVLIFALRKDHAAVTETDPGQ